MSPSSALRRRCEGAAAWWALATQLRTDTARRSPVAVAVAVHEDVDADAGDEHVRLYAAARVDAHGTDEQRSSLRGGGPKKERER